jgi:demethylmenaquinone methyltransferase/2-methoxy-6-polyprenyl-1,4-benzoquinol methylase
MFAVDSSRDHAVQNIFDRIAGRYDRLNRVISFRLDNRWRRRAIHSLQSLDNPVILDLGAGTGDLTFMAAAQSRGRARVIGLDFSQPMLRLAQKKRSVVNFADKTSFVVGSALCSPFKEQVFDAVMTAFVLRNVSDLSVFFTDAFRVTKAGGRLVSLDMFPPSSSWFSPFYGIYFYGVVPWIGGLLAGDRNAYSYLSRSVRHFDSPEKVGEIIEACGYRRLQIQKFLNGAVCMHSAEKPLT